MNIIIDKTTFDGVLVHLVFDTQDGMNGKLEKISHKREALKKLTYRGHNFPGEFLDFDIGIPKNECYIIGYIENDYETLDHELCHAKFHFDKKYRNEIQELWDSLSNKEQMDITYQLFNMGYKQEFHLDEFQAYLYSEPIKKGKNFWNIDMKYKS